MADDAAAGSATVPAGIPNVKIVQDIPVVFADGVMSQSYIAGIAKFYFYRTDSSPDLSGPNVNHPVVQVVMPAQGFAQMLHFFQHRLKTMIAEGAISQEVVDTINKTVYDAPRKT